MRFRAAEPGTFLGRYELLEVIGQGGMATVFRGRDGELRREVAVKVLFPHLCQNREVARRFQREARAAAALEDARIVRVLDVGGGNGSGVADPPYIVLELCRGGSVETRLEGVPPPPAEIAAALGARVAGALAIAHRAGIVHRDVKPANVLVLEAGRVALADFGVARVVDDDSIVTRTGALVGTPSFMSPEQAMGDAATGASDLYSLGATLYRVATGALPFSGPTPRVVAAIASGDFVAPLRRCRDMGPDLAAAIAKLMALEPGDRYPDAEAAEAALVAVATAGGIEDLDAALADYFEAPEATAKRLAPVILDATLARAETAARGGNIARALALADRALALCPDDSRALAVARRLSSRRRWRAISLAAAGALAIAAALAAGLWAWPAGQERAVGLADARGAAVAAADARSLASGGGAPDAPSDLAAENRHVDGPHPGAGASVSIAESAVKPRNRRHRPRVARNRRAEPGPRAAKNRGDHGPHPRVGASVRPKDAAVKASEPMPRDAGAPPPDAPPAPATVTLVVNVWCDLTVDGKAAGQVLRTKKLTLAPGRHRLRCSQGPGMPSWAQTLTLAPGEARRLSAEVLRAVTVTIALSAADAIEARGRRHANGTTIELSPDRYRVTIIKSGRPAGGGWVTVPRAATACTLRDSLRLFCKP